MVKHIIVKIQKTKEADKILKVAKAKKANYIQRGNNQTDSWRPPPLPTKVLKSEGDGISRLESAERNNMNRTVPA